MASKLWCAIGVHSYGEEKNGKIVCSICGKISIVPCRHKYEYVGVQKFEIGPPIIYSMCVYCGDIKTTE